MRFVFVIESGPVANQPPKDMPLDPAPVIASAIDSRTKKTTRKAKKPRVKKIKTHRPRRESTKTIMARLYKTWSAIAHARAGEKCEVCGATGKLDAHHVQPRQICSGLRFDPHNAVLLCPSHHKYGHRSAHKGMLWFADWFKTNRPDDYEYVMERLDFEIDCKSRIALYNVERDLHDRYGDAIEPLSTFDVEWLERDGERRRGLVQGYNARAAETMLAWEQANVAERPMKGIISCKEVRPPSREQIDEWRKELWDKGIMDENGNAINRPEMPTCTDEAKLAFVQSFEGAVR